MQDKAVTELRADVDEATFPGLMALTRPRSQLADAPPSWVKRLAGAKGAYLLACPRDGSHYVGSAAATGGFWARWAQYRANGHGGNIALIGRSRSDYVVSILQVAGSSDTDHDILAIVARRSGCDCATIRMRTADRDGAKMCGVAVGGKPQVSG